MRFKTSELPFKTFNYVLILTKSYYMTSEYMWCSTKVIWTNYSFKPDTMGYYNTKTKIAKKK